MEVELSDHLAHRCPIPFWRKPALLQGCDREARLQECINARRAMTSRASPSPEPEERTRSVSPIAAMAAVEPDEAAEKPEYEFERILRSAINGTGKASPIHAAKQSASMPDKDWQTSENSVVDANMPRDMDDTAQRIARATHINRAQTLYRFMHDSRDEASRCYERVSSGAATTNESRHATLVADGVAMNYLRRQRRRDIVHRLKSAAAKDSGTPKAQSSYSMLPTLPPDLVAEPSGAIPKRRRAHSERLPRMPRICTRESIVTSGKFECKTVTTKRFQQKVANCLGLDNADWATAAGVVTMPETQRDDAVQAISTPLRKSKICSGAACIRELWPTSHTSEWRRTEWLRRHVASIKVQAWWRAQLAIKQPLRNWNSQHRKRLRAVRALQRAARCWMLKRAIQSARLKVIIEKCLGLPELRAKLVLQSFALRWRARRCKNLVSRRDHLLLDAEPHSP
eukprot:NODE_6633_length_1653_cov_14.418742.p1 GENE.NODE_6633_length_1653_cov_14.418742~~NODE_6633_length_1653_cov_14.418742.p1  ORF type:complete len:532 (+),score=82.49 NODE_6633_length_1653_cov_14.418742:230-1597(+)